MASITNIQSTPSVQKTSLQIQEEFREFYTKHVPANPYLTDEMIHKSIQKPIYSSIKNVENVKFQLCLNNFSYFAIIYYIFLYSQYEFWTIIDEHQAYMISTEGRVWSSHTNKCLSLGNFERMEKENSYIRVGLHVKGKRNAKMEQLHILVMKSFFPRDGNLFEFVNHKDGGRLNPILLNVEPSDRYHNPEQAREILKKGCGVEVCRSLVLSNDDNDVVCYNSLAECARENYTTVHWINRFIDEKMEAVIKGKKYTFTREKPIRQRLILDITKEEFVRRFRQINHVTYYDKTGKLVTIEFGQYHICGETGIVVVYNFNKDIYEVIKSKLINGYLSIQLHKNRDEYVFQINRLILIAHLPPPCIVEDGIYKFYWDLFADHIDENKRNDTLSNLRWVTPRQNSLNSAQNKPIRVTYNGISNVFPSSTIFSGLYSGIGAVGNIRNAARLNEKFLDNDFQYISEEEYHNEKDKNQSLFLFKNEPYSVAKYLNGVQIEVFTSIDKACESIGITRSPFDRAIKESYSMPYILEYNGLKIPTPLYYRTAEYHGYNWFVLEGTIVIVEKERVEAVCK